MFSKNKSVIIRQIICYLAGMFFIASGVIVSRCSDLGVSPVNSVPAVLSEITCADLGVCTTAVFIIYVLVQLILLGRLFKKASLLQFISSVVFGWFVSLAEKVLVFIPECTNYIMRLVYVIISMFLIAFGLILYLNSELIPMPAEGVTLALVQKTGIKLPAAKIIFDWSQVIIAAALSMIFLGELVGVREGTVIAALGVGLCLKLVSRFLCRYVEKFLCKEKINTAMEK